LGGNCVVPEGTRYFFSFHPGLTPWAKINSAPPPPHFAQKRRELGTPAAGLDFAQSFHRTNFKRVLKHALKGRSTVRPPIGTKLRHFDFLYRIGARQGLASRSSSLLAVSPALSRPL